MLKNYFLVAWRNIWRHKGFSFLNITGLAIAMAAATLILLWIQSESRYDRNFKNDDRIYEVWNRMKYDGNINCWSTTPKVMASAIKADYPEVEQAVRVNYSYPLLFSIGDKRIKGSGYPVDSNFFEVFDYEFIEGNAQRALASPESVVLSESFANSLFGDEPAVGKVLKLDNVDNSIVQAVVKDPSPDSRFQFKYLVPWSYLRKKGGDDDNWGNNSTKTFVMLKENTSLAAVAPKIQHLRKKYDKSEPDMETFLYPFGSSYLYGRFENGVVAGGRIELVRLFGWIAAFILLVACINFMNLSTARSERRAREVGIRKVVGARRPALLLQFLGESILLCLLAACIALLLVQLFLPAFNQLVDKKLAIEWASPQFWLSALGFIFVTGLLAGSYPAFFLASFRPVKVLKGAIRPANALVTPRKLLVVGQFTFAILLIIATIVVRQQMKMAQERQSGYGRENLVYSFMEGDIEKNYAVIRAELLNSGAVESISKTSAPFTESWSNTWDITWRGKDPEDRRLINRMCGDDDVVKTAGLQLVAGRDIDLQQYPTDSNAVLINEAAAKLMGLDEPVGEIIGDIGEEFHIVGIVKDFIVQSPYEPVAPMVILGAKGFFNVVNMRLSSKQSTKASLDQIEVIFKKYNPEYPFLYTFADEEYARKFDSEKRSSTLASLFAILTIVISCLGLFGLAAYMAENRTKEVGVRKVLGASVADIARLLSVDFVKLVLIAFVLAAPLGYWAMHTWLKDYTYRVPLHWWIFGLAGLMALIIALVTVSSQAIKAARSNPVKSLRSE
ncbi:MAG: ABC transporter permease [Chitinophagaceae bacterium]